MTAEQQSKLAKFQAALRQRNLAQVSATRALEAANLAAGQAADAEHAALVANQAAAAAALRSAEIELEATQMQGVVEGFVRQMALSEQGGSELLVALVVSGKPPSEVLRQVESSDRTASAVTDALRSLVTLTQQTQEAAAEVETTQAHAVAAAARAHRKAHSAARLLTAARTRLLTSQGHVTGMLSTDPVLAEAADTAGIPGCAPFQDTGALYPNGMLPPEVLCEPLMAPGHRLRSDAAKAFDAMARAYAKQMGEPLCITDSYRSYAAQVELKVRKPFLAATPGTSNHGWGVAVDMCGGIENFGTPAHAWMDANAGLFGWLHPSWAEPAGSKPEPWHWEFSPELAAQMHGLLHQAHHQGGQGHPRSHHVGQGHHRGRKSEQRLLGTVQLPGSVTVHLP